MSHPIIVSLGIDCGPSGFLKEIGSRFFSLPFDWVVTYSGVSEIIKNSFDTYVPSEYFHYDKIYNDTISGVRYVHHKFPQDCNKLKRRVNRFLDLLNQNQEIIFIRKGHSFHHHGECEKFNFTLEDDISDSEKLSEFLTINYPNLKFKILVFLRCKKCYSNTDECFSKNIRCYNLLHTSVGYEKILIDMGLTENEINDFVNYIEK